MVKTLSLNVFIKCANPKKTPHVIDLQTHTKTILTPQQKQLYLPL